MSLLYIAFVLLLRYNNSYATPIHPTMSSSNDNAWNSSLVSSEIEVPMRRRSMYNVARSCIVTVFICAWTSVHPNVPPRRRMGGVFARVKLMFWTIVAPELVLAWAVRQWFAAREVRDIYNKRKGWRCWTKEHGHFLVMGGYQLVNEDFKEYEERGRPGLIATPEDWDNYYAYQKRRQKSQLGVLTLDRFEELIKDPKFKFPRITAAEIRDRSKGDGVSKLIAILQTSWFIAQCIERGLQHVALTELELVTLAMASLNAITFAFWWSKPLSVQEPMNVYVPTVAIEKVDEYSDDVTVTTRDVIGIGKVGLAVRFIFDPLRYYRQGHNLVYATGLYLVRLPYHLFFVLTFPVFVLFPLGILFLLWTIKMKKVEKAQGDETVGTRIVLVRLCRLLYRLTHSIRQHFAGKMAKVDVEHRPFILNWVFVIPVSFILLIVLLIVLSPLFAFFFIASFTSNTVFEIVTTNTVPPGAMQVPSFYAPRTHSDRYSRMVIFATFGTTLGGIYCLGWFFSFPTRFEQSTWRYTSGVLTVIPLIAASIDCISENIKLDGKFGKNLRLLLGIFMTTLLFVYVPARLFLFVQAVAILRNQPASAFLLLDRTKYFPHLSD